MCFVKTETIIKNVDSRVKLKTDQVERRDVILKFTIGSYILEINTNSKKDLKVYRALKNSIKAKNEKEFENKLITILTFSNNAVKEQIVAFQTTENMYYVIDGTLQNSDFSKELNIYELANYYNSVDDNYVPML